MSSYQDTIDEIVEATDKLAGEGFGSEVRGPALHVALQVWMTHQFEKQERERMEAAVKQNQAAGLFFSSVPPKG